jgi:hypothetical protein
MVFGGDSCKNGVTADKGMGNDSAEDTWRGVRNEVTCSRTAQRRTPSDVPGGLLVSLLRVSAFSSDLPLSWLPRLSAGEQKSRRTGRKAETFNCPLAGSGAQRKLTVFF